MPFKALPVGDPVQMDRRKQIKDVSDNRDAGNSRSANLSRLDNLRRLR
jgi:hypothetical protein